ncbi:MAG TPA: biotin/lipoyl-containing protein [Gemmatimonadaceae bacterium]|nr:biotin/lipoyl-containing protein [Gemmatimonadaceae bacterium]
MRAATRGKGDRVKYIVDLNGERHEVTLRSDAVAFESQMPVPAQLSDIEGSPVKIIRLGAEVFRVVVEKREGRGRYFLWVDGYRFDVEALDERRRALRDLSAASAGPTGPAPIVAPMPGLIVRVNVVVGDTVEAGQGVVVMEAMKMENELRATAAGKVRSVEVEPGTAVEKGALLVALE